jgi:hypothetical protein
MTIQTISPSFLAAHSPGLAKCDTREPLHNAHFVILSSPKTRVMTVGLLAAKNPAIFGLHNPFFGILHSADSVQNDNLLCAEVFLAEAERAVQKIRSRLLGRSVRGIKSRLLGCSNELCELREARQKIRILENKSCE